MNNRGLLLKNTTYNLLGYLFLTVAALISLPILLQNLGKNAFGLYLLITGFVPLLGAIDYGLGKAAIRQLSLPDTTSGHRSSIWKSSLVLYLATGILNTLATFVIIAYFVAGMDTVSELVPDLFLPAVLLSAVVLVNHLNNFLLILPQSQQRFDIYATRTFIVGIGNTYLPALVSFRYHSLSMLIAVMLVFQLISLVTLFRFNWRMFKDAVRRPLSKRRLLLGYGLRQFIGTVASQLDLQVSKVILTGMLTASAVTFFSLPQNLIIKAAGGISQLTLALFPLSAGLSDRKHFPILKLLISRLQIGILIIGLLQVAAVYTLGESALALWLGNREVVSMTLPVLKILSWYFLLTTLTPIPTSVLEAIGFPQIPSIFAVLTTVLDISLMWFLIGRFDYLGPAYSLVISSLITVPLFLFVFTLTLNRYHKSLS